MAIAPFWFSTEHLWSAITPFWLSTDDIKGQVYLPRGVGVHMWPPPPPSTSNLLHVCTRTKGAFSIYILIDLRNVEHSPTLFCMSLIHNRALLDPPPWVKQSVNSINVSLLALDPDWSPIIFQVFILHHLHVHVHVLCVITVIRDPDKTTKKSPDFF